uniref:Sm domain-containing protein n=1 Tax=Globodera rostochiensis TaxID=31243 RepID=A0A914GUD3_GLORO
MENATESDGAGRSGEQEDSHLVPSSDAKIAGGEAISEPGKGVERWLGETLRVELIDGRVIYGRFVCTDNVPNIILMDSREFWMFKEDEAGGDRTRIPIRRVGMVLIRGEHIKRIFHIVLPDKETNAKRTEEEWKSE